MNSQEKLASILYRRFSGEFPEAEVIAFVAGLQGKGVETWLEAFDDNVETQRPPKNPLDIKRTLQGNYRSLYEDIFPALSRSLPISTFHDFTLYFIQNALHHEQYVYGNNVISKRHFAEQFKPHRGKLDLPFKTNDQTIGYFVYDPETISGMSLSCSGHDITCSTHAWQQG